MNRFTTLPKIMVAPNGPRYNKKDHKSIPITISEIVDDAINCLNTGANAMHAHVRDKYGNHSLDVGLYNELINELKIKAPNLLVQITTEAFGIFSLKDQIKTVKSVMPESASVVLKEALPDIRQNNLAKEFYYWAFEANVYIQHILFSHQDFLKLIEAIKLKIIPEERLFLLFVLGRYNEKFQSNPKELDIFFQERKKSLPDSEWAVCAFGKKETECLIKAYSLGGKVRVGFENKVYNLDGSLAKNNSERVKEIISHIS